MPPTGITVLHLTTLRLTRGARVRWELRKLRRAQRAGRPLDALTAAARIHDLAVRPNMRHGGWPRAQASSERVLSRMPDRRAAGYAPGLRGVIEGLHAD